MIFVRNFLKDDSGQFAVITALMAVPLLVCVAIAIESTSKIRKNRSLQSALDSAALAAVIPGNLTIAEREAFAEQVFFENFKTENGVKVETTATNSRVDISAELVQENLFIDLMDRSNSIVGAKATAVRTVEDVICVMTLDENETDSLRFEKDAKFSAPNCSIQVNSNARHAMSSNGNFIPEANSICIVGGARGRIPNDVKTDCAPVADPYAGKFQTSNMPCDFGPVSYFDFSSYQEVMTVGEQVAVRKPGVYCDGLHIYDSTVKFEPGTYIIKDGPLTVGHNSKIYGDGVTFVFTGNDSVLYTYENVEMDLKAPKTGNYAGLIFFQDRNSSAGETSIIKGGVNMKLVGTMYFPTQNLFIGGYGTMGASSPAMAFIANNITFTSDIDKVISDNEAYILDMKNMLEFVVGLAGSYGLTDYQVSAASARMSTTTEFMTSIRTSGTSHQSAGLPPILPRADAGARLIMSE